MPLSSDKYILPPPPGVGNDLYEPFAQKADTVFDKPSFGGTTFNDRFPDLTTNRVVGNPGTTSSDQNNFFAPLSVDASTLNYDYLNSDPGQEMPGAKNAPTTFRDDMQSALTQGDKAIEGAIGLPSGTLSTTSASAFSMDNIVKLIVRAIVVILGFIFVAVGLTMLGAKSRVGSEVIREVKRSIPR